MVHSSFFEYHLRLKWKRHFFLDYFGIKSPHCYCKFDHNAMEFEWFNIHSMPLLLEFIQRVWIMLLATAAATDAASSGVVGLADLNSFPVFCDFRSCFWCAPASWNVSFIFAKRRKTNTIHTIKQWLISVQLDHKPIEWIRWIVFILLSFNRSIAKISI